VKNMKTSLKATTLFNNKRFILAAKLVCFCFLRYILYIHKERIAQEEQRQILPGQPRTNVLQITE